MRTWHGVSVVTSVALVFAGCSSAEDTGSTDQAGSGGSESSAAGAGATAQGASTSGGQSPIAGAGSFAGARTEGGSSASGTAGAEAGGTSAGASGGTSDGGSSDGGSSLGGGVGSGGTATWTAGDYASRKWARWPIPNPTSLGLPHPMSLSDVADGVLDAVTGLLWEKEQSAATMTWQAALDYCAQKGKGWSLPTRIELTSIVDNTQTGVKVGSKLLSFQPKAGWTWASTPWVVNSRKMVNPPLSWFINLSQGDSNNSLSQLAASAYARCVRVPVTQPLPAEHYTVANGEVRDNFTGLGWQQSDSGSTPSLSASQAAEHCQSLPLNGRAWRLPSLNELASVVDDVPTGNVSPAAVHQAFPTLSKDQWYWSVSPHGASTTEGWMLNFMDGFTKHQPVATLGIALCVHD